MKTLSCRVKAWYGDVRCTLPVPEEWEVLSSGLGELRPLSPAERDRALDRPIEAEPIEEIARRARSAVIVVEDITRPTPTRQIVPALLRRLHRAGLDEDSIRFVFALGGHRQMPRQEMVKKLGHGVVGRYEVLNHDLDGRFGYCGRSSRGTPIYIGEPVLQADVKILLGTAYPRPGTGFGGGAKCLVPGVAAQATIESYHSKRGGDPLDPNNPMREDIEEIARLVGVDWIVNAVLDGERRIAGLFAGDVVAAHRAAADFVKQHSLFPLVPDAEIVISNAYPFDTNLRYAWRGVWPFGFHLDAVHVLVDFSPEGGGYHQFFKARGRPFAVRSDEPPRWYLYSPEIGPKEAYEVHPECEHFRRWEDLIARVQRERPGRRRVAFYPHAGIGWRR
ncbi:MAG: hypothetical protein KatS3mg115_0169 [Candidatus Poribacteria bacterium]|nr:MAG: hypothetical protein KatS3mg115_0169 [Candidatus Poribacteria bacterium]